MVRYTLVRDFITGAFAIGAIVGLCVTLMLVGELTGFGEKTYRFQVRMENGGGIAATSPVTYNGVKIGKVVRTDVVAPPDVGADIEVEVREKARIPKTARLSVDKGLVGDSTLEFSVGKTEAAAATEYIKAGDVFVGGSPETLLGKVQSMIDKPLAKLTQTAENIDKLAAEYTTLGQRLNDMVEPRTPADVEGGKQPNIRSTLARLDSALRGADRWLNDEELKGRAERLLARANDTMDEFSKLSSTLTRTAEKADGVVTDVGAAANDLRARASELATQGMDSLKKVDDIAASMSELLAGVKQGKGTLGQLTQNPDLYNALRGAADRLDKALLELQLTLEKYKAEGIRLKL